MFAEYANIPWLAADDPRVIVQPLRLIRPVVIVRLEATVTLFVVMLTAGLAPEVLAMVRFVNWLAVEPLTVCAEVPASITPAAAAVLLSLNMPLLVKLPRIVSDASDALANVTDEALGNVDDIVRFLHAADVPLPINGMAVIPVPFVITTSVVNVGTALPHQLLAVAQLLVVPNHPPAASTVTFEAAEVLVQALDVILTLTQVV